ncbi:MAG TPA: four helix bundle protein [Flavobacteriales bacterium]|nr:four helix bundle protein [Flavobacteriales bacterium]
MHKIKDLKIWIRSKELAVNVYKATGNFPTEERFGLTSQIRKASVSIPSNISEGAGRNSRKEFSYFIGIALGSLFDLQTQLILANRLKMIDEETTRPLLDEIEALRKMKYALQQKFTQTPHI